MNYNVIFKEGEPCKWRCMVDNECRDNAEEIISAKWYDVIVAATHGTAMTLMLTNEHGKEQLVPHYAYGTWADCSQIGILNPELATERMRAYVQKQINEQKAHHQTRMNNLRHEMRTINIKGFVDEPAVLVETNA
jgi:hypothetical protein